MTTRVLKKLRRDEKGMSAIEFALISIPMSVMIFGMLEIGYQGWVTAMLQGTIQEVGRRGSFEAATMGDITNFAKGKMSNFIKSPDISVTAENFRTFRNVGKPEKLTTDTAPLGTYNVGDCFLDEQTNGVYDANMAGKAGIGSAESVVRYNITVTYKRLTPIAGIVGMQNPVVLTRTTFIRNEPFEGVVPPPTICT